jgi:fatty acid synthase
MNNSPIGMKALANNISIHVIDLSTMFQHAHYKVILHELIQKGIDNNEIIPLHIDKQFHHSCLDEAIRYMGGGNHMGKIVIDMKTTETNTLTHEMKTIQPRFYTFGRHIIVGGMGGFGMELASWLIECGADKIELVGRNGITNLYQKTQFEKYGDKFEYKYADITCENDVENIFNVNPLEIKGVWNLTLILRDKLYKDMDNNDWNFVVDVKYKASFLLSKYCPTNVLFVMWSSVCSLVGNAGQTNYAYGNFMMEEICRERRLKGLHALAINWGAIDNIGYLSKDSSKVNTHISSFTPQNIDDCLNDLHYLLCSSNSVISCYKNPQYFDNGDKIQVSLLEKVLSVLGINKTSIDTLDKNTSLSELGMDSLQVVSIKNLLKNEGRTMNNVEIQKMKLNDL